MPTSKGMWVTVEGPGKTTKGQFNNLIMIWYKYQALGALGNGECHPFNMAGKAPWQGRCGEQWLGQLVLAPSIIAPNHSLSCCFSVDSTGRCHHRELESELRQINGRPRGAHKKTTFITYRPSISWGRSELLGSDIGVVGRNSCPACGERWEAMPKCCWHLPFLDWEIQAAGILKTLSTKETYTPQKQNKTANKQKNPFKRG